ncbi:hypothetical protein PLEOSDRAFT_1102756 [Pleurotus ostreatus PC15]|uniref:Uncharacterized protein n=1 Tax=Pleurotus ostreatus (strain PC15) TaxID=1137138 RepID=A0A067NYM6_PLEO1|nr:hypothetical protein PLEOSDRAFT_1102756 [Pleurotus ostreatus PC15]
MPRSPTLTILANRWMSAQARRVVDTALSPTATPIDINDEEEAGELVVKGSVRKRRQGSCNPSAARDEPQFHAIKDEHSVLPVERQLRRRHGDHAEHDNTSLARDEPQFHSTTTQDNTLLARDEPQFHAIKDEHGVLPVERQLRQRHDDHAEHVCAEPARDDDAG